MRLSSASRSSTPRSSTPRSCAPLVVTLVLVGLFCVGMGVGQIAGLSVFDWWSSFGSHSDKAFQRSIPTRLSIPSLGVRANVLEVGRASDGSIAPPPSDPAKAAGWYGLGPTPGEQGTAVIVGHVDTQAEPAVFHKLSELRRGKLIEVNREDRRVASFKVDSVERFPKSTFPGDKIFEMTERPRLVLVTCGGTWVGGQVGYADNVIVFATLA
jgi:sortase (surface protein transpeptidase)